MFGDDAGSGARRQEAQNARTDLNPLPDEAIVRRLVHPVHGKNWIYPDPTTLEQRIHIAAMSRSTGPSGDLVAFCSVEQSQSNCGAWGKAAKWYFEFPVKAVRMCSENTCDVIHTPRAHRYSHVEVAIALTQTPGPFGPESGMTCFNKMAKIKPFQSHQ
jgi:hypothetical protein